MILGEDLAQLLNSKLNERKSNSKAARTNQPESAARQTRKTTARKPEESSQQENIPEPPTGATKQNANSASGENIAHEATRPATQEKRTRILRIDQLAVMIGVKATTIYEKLNPKSRYYDKTFPKQISLGPSAVGWDEAEVIAWLEQRKECGKTKNRS